MFQGLNRPSFFPFAFAYGVLTTNIYPLYARAILLTKINIGRCETEMPKKLPCV